MKEHTGYTPQEDPFHLAAINTWNIICMNKLSLLPHFWALASPICPRKPSQHTFILLWNTLPSKTQTSSFF